MKKLIPLLVIITVLALSSCMNLYMGNLTIKEGVLTVGVFKHAPPAVYEENGELTGYEVELISEIAKRMGLSVEFKEYLFQDLLLAVERNNVDCAISDITITKEREEQVIFTRAYSKTELIVLVPKNSDIETITDLNGKRVGVINSAIHEVKARELQKSMTFEIVQYNTQTDVYEDLRLQKIDATINELDNFEDSTYTGYFDVLPEHLDVLYSGIAVNKNNKELRTKMDQVLLELEKEGYIEELKLKYK